MNETLRYYNKNAKKFTEKTRDVLFSDVQDKFLAKIPNCGKLLDFGCGSGRDTRYFLSKGYNVTAIDGSEEMCAIASKYTGQPVQKLLFLDFNEVDSYDGIWACASILHLSMKELPIVFKKLSLGLHVTGILYISFKYGEFQGIKHGRYFTYLNEKSLDKLLISVPDFIIEEQWITGDVREGREQEKWLNVLLKKHKK